MHSERNQRLADDAGVESVINARTAALLHGKKKFNDTLGEAARRVKECETAVARSLYDLYPVRVPDSESLQVLLSAVSIPVNVTTKPPTGAPSGTVKQLRAMGVRRIGYDRCDDKN